jgi:hypothetical protein
MNLTKTLLVMKKKLISFKITYEYKVLTKKSKFFYKNKKHYNFYINFNKYFHFLN